MKHFLVAYICVLGLRCYYELAMVAERYLRSLWDDRQCEVVESPPAQCRIGPTMWITWSMLVSIASAGLGEA
ncbi:hypothetical protein TSMEX_000280 [Taenia solium]|eukprot:TsM_000343700 transcript=TsM_000343700 gene=TsM_000343700